MKTIFNALLVALMLTAVGVNTAQADPNRPKQAAAFQTGIYTTTEGKLQVAVQKETTSPVLVHLVNAKGDHVFSQRMSKRQEAIRLRLDMRDLPDGVYQVVISNGIETTTKEVTMTTKPSAVVPRLVAIH